MWLFFLAAIAGGLVYDRTLEDLYTSPKRAALQILAAGSLCLLFGWKAARGQGFSWPKGGWIALVAFGTALVSAARSGAPAESAHLIRDGVVFLATVWLGQHVVSEASALRQGLNALGVLSTGVAALGLLQLAELDEWPPGLGLPRWFEHLPATDRPGSTFGHVNFASEVVALGLVAQIGLLCRGLGDPGVAAFLRRGTLALQILVAVWFLGVGGCRSAWAGALGGGLFAAAMGLRAQMGADAVFRWASLLLVATPVLFFLADPWVKVPGRGGGPDVSISHRLRDLATLEDGTEAERLVLWKNTVAMVEANPLLGVGPGAWKFEYPRFSRADAVLGADRFGLSRQPEATHMESLQVLAELGWLGGGAAILFVLWRWLGLVRKRGLPPSSSAEHGVSGGVVLAAFLMSIGAYVFQNPVPTFWVALFLGAGGRNVSARSRGGPAGSLGIALSAATLTIVLALHHHARLEGNRASHLAAHDLFAAGIPVADRSALPLSESEFRARARDALDVAVTREPNNFRYHYRRAYLLWNQGLLDAAKRAFELSLSLHPAFLNAYLGLSTLILQEPSPDFARVFELLSEALRIQPNQPETRYAMGLLFEERSRRADSARGALRAEALAQYESAASLREYMPFARLGAARLLIEDGAPLPRILGHLAKAEENASRDAKLLAEVARMYSDSRLAAPDGLFGRAGSKSLAVWKRVLALTRETDQEAQLAVRSAGLIAAEGGGPPVSPAELESLRVFLEGAIESRPDDIMVRSIYARWLEAARRPEEALREWGVVLRIGQARDWKSARFRLLLDEAVSAQLRLRESTEDPVR